MVQLLEVTSTDPPATAIAVAARLRGVELTYPGGVTALRRLDLSIEQGTHVVVLGASGSGKTTLMGLLSRRLAPSQGTLEIHGRVAVIYQDLRLVKQRTVLANVLDGALGRHGTVRSLAGMPRLEKQRAIRLLHRVGLPHRMHTPVGRLSGGEQQRAAIARALMQAPQILLADEPVAALDSANARSIMRLLCELQHKQGLTLISVLHDCALAEEFADRIIGFESGELVYDERPDPSRLFKRFSPCHACEVISGTVDAGASPGEQRSPALRKALWTGLVVFVLLGLFAWCAAALDITARQGENIVSNIIAFAQRLVPTTVSQWKSVPWAQLLAALWRTIEMAFLGTLVACGIALPVSAVAARNVAPLWVVAGARFMLNCVRATPSIIWAIIFVAAVGLGELAGVLALTMYSLGYLTKFFYEHFEAIDPGPPDALRELGAGTAARFCRAVWPASQAPVLSSCIFMFEYNVRSASVFGIVGAGGIGYELMIHKDWGNWHIVGMIVAMLIVVVLILDTLSTRLRRWIVRG